MQFAQTALSLANLKHFLRTIHVLRALKPTCKSAQMKRNTAPLARGWTTECVLCAQMSTPALTESTDSISSTIQIICVRAGVIAQASRSISYTLTITLAIGSLEIARTGYFTKIYKEIGPSFMLDPWFTLSIKFISRSPSQSTGCSTFS